MLAGSRMIVELPVGDSDALAAGILGVLDNDARRAELVAEGSSVVGTYDWPVVAEQILRVYETVTVGAGRVREVRS